jgi:hypothetical protein
MIHHVNAAVCNNDKEMSYNQVRAREVINIRINKSTFRCLTFTSYGINEVTKDAQMYKTHAQVSKLFRNKFVVPRMSWKLA